MKKILFILTDGLKWNKDIGQRELFIIEAHDFFSVGLYSLDSERVLYMFSQWYYWKLREHGIKII